MKRSEMLNFLSKMIHEHRRRTEAVTSDELAEMLLVYAEKAGMLPPESVSTENDYDYLAVHAWEPE